MQVTALLCMYVCAIPRKVSKCEIALLRPQVGRSVCAQLQLIASASPALYPGPIAIAKEVAFHFSRETRDFHYRRIAY
jgi:hypothetical protein